MKRFLLALFLPLILASCASLSPKPPPGPVDIRSLTSEAPADNNIGIGFYGLQSPKVTEQDCGNLIHAYDGKATIRIAWLYNTFGASEKCASRLLADPRPKVVELALINETCNRANRCGPYEFLYKISPAAYEALLVRGDPAFLNRLRTYLRGAAHLFEGAQNLTCYVNPGLESNLKDARAIDRLLSETRAAFPFCKVVWNPIRPTQRYSADFVEGHTSGSPVRAAPCINNLDGQDFSTVDIGAWTKRFQSCDSAFVWSLSANGNHVGKPFIDPRSRSPFISDAEFATIHKILTDYALPTEADDATKKTCKSFLPARDGGKIGALWKSGETTGKAVWIAPGKFKRINSVRIIKQGGSIETLRFRHLLTEDGSNRRIYDSVRSLSGFPLGITINADGNCWFLDDPHGRID